jgi:hypothetical protein
VLVAWALGECGGDREFVEKLDVTMYAFRAYPAYFGFQKYPEHPDVSAVRLQLYDLLKPKNGRVFGLEAEQPIAEKARDSGLTGFRLTPLGVTWWRTNREWVGHWVSRNANSEFGTSKAADGRVSTEDDAKQAILSRVRHTAGFQLWMRNRQVTRREVGIQTFFTAFGIGPRTSRAGYVEARDRALTVVSGDIDAGGFLTFLDAAFGEDYKKMLSGEVEI